MAYLTEEDIKGRITESELNQLCFDKGPDDYLDESGDRDTEAYTAALDAAVDTVVGYAIADAESIINTYLSKRYVVPLQVMPGKEFPAFITRIACIFAIYWMFMRRQGPPKWWEIPYNDGIKTLEAFIKGNEVLNFVVATKESDFAPDVKSSKRVFSRDNMESI